jgi:hypothetical protein
MRRSLARPVRDLHRKLTGPSRHVRVVRHRQGQVTQAHQRLDQSFRGAVGQLKQGPYRQARLNGGLRVQPRLATANRWWGSPLVPNARVVEPDRQIAPDPVLLQPVCHPIALLQTHLPRIRLHALCHDPSPRTAKPGLTVIAGQAATPYHETFEGAVCSPAKVRGTRGGA